MEKTENHFLVEAVQKNGRAVSSSSVFIMGQDTVAPAVPEVIGAFLDSTGQVVIEWTANSESDLWGYRIFKSNFKEQEFALINNVILKDTIYRDSVDIRFNTENVFYKIQATDTRDNRSAFTEIIKVQKPDIFPPGFAVINNLKQASDTVMVD